MNKDFRIQIELPDVNMGLSPPFVSFIPQQRSFIGSLVCHYVRQDKWLNFEYVCI